jgi:hypothetical protein
MKSVSIFLFLVGKNIEALSKFILYLEIQLSRGEGFNPATFVCLFQLRDGFPLLYVQVFFVFNDLR